MNWRAALLLLIPLTLMIASCEEDDDSGPVTVTEEEPGLLAHATIRPDSAVALARAQVPEGRIEKAEIEREDGRLIYSFDMTADEEGEEEAEEAEEVEGEMITEIHVDALSGAILSVTEERGGEEDEAAEVAEEEEEGGEGEEMGSAARTVTEESPGLFQEAAFSPDSAFALARVRFPEAELRGGELEVEDGRLVYSLDLEVEGEGGITEVWVDARTGEIVSVEHEGD